MIGNYTRSAVVLSVAHMHTHTHAHTHTHTHTHSTEHSGFFAVPFTKSGIIVVALGYDLAPKGKCLSVCLSVYPYLSGRQLLVLTVSY